MMMDARMKKLRIPKWTWRDGKSKYTYIGMMRVMSAGDLMLRCYRAAFYALLSCGVDMEQLLLTLFLMLSRRKLLTALKTLGTTLL